MQDQVELKVDSCFHRHTVDTPILWVTSSFAPDWFNDAISEARILNDHHARRREIIFAVCFAESYLLEWVRDDVLKSDFNKLNLYFPPGRALGVERKWKEVLESLMTDGLIAGVPDYSNAFWIEFTKLVEMRNGLIHARSSRPETSGQPDKEKPLPSKGVLNKLSAGWAVNTVIELVRYLHEATGTTMPDWIRKP